MTKSCKIFIAAIVGAAPILIFAYSEGPDAGVAGVPGESTCTSCHIGSSGSGSVSVTFPGNLNYTPGVSQHLIVTVADSSQKRWGFELTARQANSAQTQAGSFTPGSDRYTQLVCTQATFRSQSFGSSCASSMPLQYIEHTLTGTRSGQRNSATFEFDWMPPATNVGDIVIYVAGNAANGDGTERGDHIYLQRYTLSAAQAPPPPPTITAVVNAASSQPGVAPDAWIAIRGTNLATTSRSLSASDIANGALPAQLDGVSVTIDGNPAFVSSLDPSQLVVQAPDDSSLGPVMVVVTNNNGASAPFTVQLQSLSPAFYLWSAPYPVATKANCGAVTSAGVFTGLASPPAQSGGLITLWGMGLAATDPTADCSFVSPAGLFSAVATAPAHPGDIVVLWGTGFGPTSPAAPAGQLVTAGQIDSVVTPPSVLIGGVPAQVVSATLTPGQAGLYQIAIQVPDGLADGDQAVTTDVSGVPVASGVAITVQN